MRSHTTQKKDFPERAVLMGSGEAVLKINNFVYRYFYR